MHIWIRLSGPGHQCQESIFLLQILLETRLFYESLQALTSFLASLVQ